MDSAPASMQREPCYLSGHHGNQTQTAPEKARCVYVGPTQRRDSYSPTSHFRLKGFVICFKIKKATSLYNSICHGDFPEFDIFWVSVNPRWELLLSNPNLRARLGILATCRTTMSKRSTLRSFRHPVHHISRSYCIWHVTELGQLIASSLGKTLLHEHRQDIGQALQWLLRSFLSDGKWQKGPFLISIWQY